MSSAESQFTERPPIVAVLGHVDHGKSTLLDYIRKTNTVSREAGGITQHVAAYEVDHLSKDTGAAKRVTFIDTPGHAAFSAIRARGASVADIAILVVAADDGVKAQTLEALRQINDAKTPFVVAINKIDKPTANVERAQASLMEHGVYLEKLGGDIPWCAISAKTGQGVDELLDLVLLVAEIGQFSANRSVSARGYVLEAHRDQKRGIAATLVITDGTLTSGMSVLAGRAISPVRIMEDHRGKSIKEASFSTPVTLVGFDELPEAGETFVSFRNKSEAELARPAPIPPRNILPKSGQSEEETGPFVLPVIIRADTTGSLEAIAHEITKLGDEYKKVSLVQSGIGSISENDINAALAGTAAAVVAGFHVDVDPIARSLARERGVRIETFDIIYKLTERITELLDEAAPKRRVEEVVGRAKVLKQFSARKGLTTIGGKMLEGFLARRGTVRVLRRGEMLGTGKVATIQANKENVDRVEIDREFGAQIESGFEVAQGDVLEHIVSSLK
ncbi:MAG: translation initiation factor translation initiation factor [Candidatus Parcubacteria bacterium]|jgi:translation initiation factor IF-2